MRTLVSLLLTISATVTGSAAYALESPGELDYPLAINQATSLTGDQVRAEAAAAHANGSYSSGEFDYRANFSLTHASGSCGSAWFRRGDPPCFLFPRQDPFSRFAPSVVSSS